MGMTSFPPNTIRHCAKNRDCLARARNGHSRIPHQRDGFILPTAGRELEETRCLPKEAANSQRMALEQRKRRLHYVIAKQLSPPIVAVADVG